MNEKDSEMGASTERSMLEPLALHEQAVVGASGFGSIWNGIIMASRHIYWGSSSVSQACVFEKVDKGIKILFYPHAYEGHGSTEDII